MTETEFTALAAQGYNRIPLVASLLADLETPLSAYLKLTQAENNGVNSFLLESVANGEQYGRYSFIGLPTQTLLRVYGARSEVVRAGTVVESHQGDPLDFIARFQARFKVAPHRPDPLPRFCGGLAGYFGYDTLRQIEKKLAHTAPKDDLGLPDIQLLLTEEVAVIDALMGKLYFIVYADPQQEGAYARATLRLQTLRAQLEKPLTHLPVSAEQPTEVIREFTKEAYLNAVGQAKQAIAAGELMQVQIGQRLIKPYTADPLALYRALRLLNPSPYMYFYHFDTCHIIGASPEILVRQEKRDGARLVTLKPLAGTRPRGATPSRDAELATELLNDPKEIAEHVMLIDLARNDLGRIAQTGSVIVTESMSIEKYSHVQHIVSAVEGHLKPGLTNFDVLRATFPAGTLTGAPKVRALELIDQLEPVKRGLYGGAVGYLSFSGDMDLAIAIRTGLLYQGKLYVQAAAGIVADSIPESEWQETENKARALLHAAEWVQTGFAMC
jgi:anthranilate synthase component I